VLNINIFIIVIIYLTYALLLPVEHGLLLCIWLCLMVSLLPASSCCIWNLH